MMKWNREGKDKVIGKEKVEKREENEAKRRKRRKTKRLKWRIGG
jgi:hypothetical protein